MQSLAIRAWVLPVAALGVAGVMAAVVFGGAPQQPHPAVVRVIVPERNGMSLGSGTLVAVTERGGLVVTNWHVVQSAAGPIVVAFPDGFTSPATVLRTDRDWDLAALAIWRPAAAPVRLAADAPRPGEPLVIAGYGDGWYRAAAGRCTQYVSPGTNFPFEMVELSAPARQGDSGGPIFNSRGELAGVLFGSGRGQTTGSYCGRVNWFLSPVLGDLQRGPPLAMIAQGSPPPAPGSALASAAPAAQAQNAGAQPRVDPSPLDGNSSQPSQYGPPVAAIAASPGSPGVREPDRQSSSRADASAATASGVPADGGGGAASVAQHPLTWDDMAGSTPAEQLKTILAAVGLVAVFLQGLRWLGSLHPR